MKEIEFEFRPAEQGDREWLWDTKRVCLRPYVEQTWGAWDDEAQRQRFIADFFPDHVQVVTSGGQDVGYVGYRFTDDELRLSNIMIRPEHQNRGLGGAVIERLKTEARAHHRPIRLQVLKVNPARRLYERLGFTPFQETPTHVKMEWIDPA